MRLAINDLTSQAFIVADYNLFNQTYHIEPEPVEYTKRDIFVARCTGTNPDRPAWIFYQISLQASSYAHQLCESHKPYVCIGRPWLSESAFTKFSHLQARLNRIPQVHEGYDTVHITDKVAAVKENALALDIELVEMLQELPHKTWCDVKDQTWNESAALEELIDVFFFAFNIAIAMYWTYADLIVTMAYKTTKNFKRLTEGYNKTD